MSDTRVKPLVLALVTAVVAGVVAAPLAVAAPGRDRVPEFELRDPWGHTEVVRADQLPDHARRPAAAPAADTFPVTLTFTDHNGAPTGEYTFRFIDLAEPVQYQDYDPSGTVVAHLPKGTYYFDALVTTDPVDPGRRITQAAEPAFVVDGPETLAIDARDGRSPGFVVDRPNARPGSAVMGSWTTTEWGEVGLRALLMNFDGMYMRPSDTANPGRFDFQLEAQLAEPNGDGFAGSPYLYTLNQTAPDRVPADVVWRVRDADLAHVRSVYAVATPGTTGVRDQFLDLSLPSALDEYYSPGMTWNPSYHEKGGNANSYVVASRSYQKGRTVTERWNTGVFGPAFPYGGRGYATRSGDDLYVNLPLATDQTPDSEGWPGGTGETTLLRDGVVVGTNPVPGGGAFVMPAEPGRYTLRATATQSSRLSTGISAEWTFTSGHAQEETDLPLMAVRFAPSLDDHNAAKAGTRFVFPMYVQRNGVPAPGAVGDPVVEASYDDGATWQRARVVRDGDHWRVAVSHPASGDFVSLRSSVTDQAGDTARQTITRAYALR